MGFKIVLLWTDAVLWLLLLALVVLRAGACAAARTCAPTGARCSPTRRRWRRRVVLGAVPRGHAARQRALPHARCRRSPAPPANARGGLRRARRSRCSTRCSAGWSPAREPTYSLPLAYAQLHEGIGAARRRQACASLPRLQFGGAHLKDPTANGSPTCCCAPAGGLLGGVIVAALAALARRGRIRPAPRHCRCATRCARINRDETPLPLRAALLTLAAVCAIAGPVVALAGPYHVLGTDRTGNDVLYQALKSVRTAFVIGGLATLATLAVRGDAGHRGRLLQGLGRRGDPVPLHDAQSRCRTCC